ncbi:MAG: NAD-binding protein [Candidatus Promineifilaceae bacterium]|nr:NAD-binding protein [Candidatus Promineifilaceae bacterium]
MYIIIVGAGPLGVRLGQLAIDDGHNVVLIEENESRARRGLTELNAQILRADIDEEGILEEAKIGRADALIATSEDDRTNLMAVALAKVAGLERLIAVVNNPSNREVFARLEVATLPDPHRVIAERLFHFLQRPETDEA